MNLSVLVFLVVIGVASDDSVIELPDDPKVALNNYLTQEYNRKDLALASDSLENFDIEKHIQEQLRSKGPLFIAIEGFAVTHPGIEKYHLQLRLTSEEFLYAPGTGDVVPPGISRAQHLAWDMLVTDFARRYNLVMYYEASMIGKYPKLSPEIDVFKDIYRISEPAWKSMSLESKVLLQADHIEFLKLEEELEQLRTKLNSKKDP